MSIEQQQATALYNAIVFDGYATIYFALAKKDIGDAWQWLELTARALGVDKGQLFLKLKTAAVDLDTQAGRTWKRIQIIEEAGGHE